MKAVKQLLSGSKDKVASGSTGVLGIICASVVNCTCPRLWVAKALLHKLDACSLPRDGCVWSSCGKTSQRSPASASFAMAGSRTH